MNAPKNSRELTGNTGWVAVDLGEAAEVNVATPRTHAEFLLSLSLIPTGGAADRTTVLALLPDDSINISGMLDLAQGRAGRVVLTFATVDSPVVMPTAMSRRSAQLVLEADKFRAVVGAMLSLKSGDSLWIVWPNMGDRAEIIELIEQGRRWRATYEQPENGELYHLPPVG